MIVVGTGKKYLSSSKPSVFIICSLFIYLFFGDVAIIHKQNPWLITSYNWL